MSATPPSIAGTARRLLELVEGFYERHAGDEAEEPIPGALPLPEVRGLRGGAPREVAWDHDDGQVTIALERVLWGPDPGRAPGSAQTGRQGIGGAVHLRQAVLEVQVVRAAPGLDPDSQEAPDPDVLDEHGDALLVDAAMLSAAITEATVTKALELEGSAPAGWPRRIIVGDAVSLGPMGYLSAVAITITITVP